MKSKDTILQIYDQYHRTQYLEWDPLSVAHRFRGHEDLELIALISALFAFGGVKQILASIEKALALLGCEGGGLLLLLREPDEKKCADLLLNRLKGFRHRIYVDRDLVGLMLLYRRSFLAHGSLKNHFLKFHNPAHETIETGVNGLVAAYKQSIDGLPIQAGTHFKHMLNSPQSKSVCKRWVMYLKWMIRPNDGIDLGLWHGTEGLRPDQLVIPLDTHLFNISQRLRLTRRKSLNWEMALEVTRALKKVDALDPTRFDFSLCRWGMFEYRKLHEVKKP